MAEKNLQDIIKKWAKEKAAQGIIEFDDKIEAFRCEKFIRYRTKETTALIHDFKGGISTWGGPYHYFYEIDLQNKTKLRLQLSFCYKNISDQSKQICEAILSKFRMLSRKENENNRGYYRWVCDYYVANIDASLTEEDIKRKMDQLFYQMKGYETFIIYKMQEPDQSVQKEVKKTPRNNKPTKEDYARYKEELQEKEKNDKKFWVRGELEFLREFKVEGDYNTVLQQVKRLNSLYKTRLSNDECKKMADFISYSDIFRDRILTNDRDVAASLVMELAEAAKEIRGRSNLSFASKYCHHCNPNIFPIFDSLNVLYLKSHYSFTSKGDYRKYMDTYALFCQDIGVDLSNAEDKEEGFWVDKFINNLDKKS